MATENHQKTMEKLETATGALGLVTAAGAASMCLILPISFVIDKIREYKQKKRQKVYNEGYDAAEKVYKEQIEFLELKLSNKTLLEESLKEIEGAAE